MTRAVRTPRRRGRAAVASVVAVLGIAAACGTSDDERTYRTIATDDPCQVIKKEDIAASLNVAPRSQLALGPFHDNVPIFPNLPGVHICKFTATTPSGAEPRAYIGLVPGLGRESLDNWKRATNPQQVAGVGAEAWWSPPELAVLLDNKVVAVGLYGSVVPDRTALERAKRIALTGLAPR